MSGLLWKIKNDYILRYLFDYIKFNRVIKITKYNNALKKKLQYTNDDINKFIYVNKIIKPIANPKNYISIINRIIFNSKNNNNNNDEDDNLKKSEKLIVDYYNKNFFIPQINNPKYLLKDLKQFKIGYNQKFLNYFFVDGKSLSLNNLIDFCNTYGNKLKEITFLDNILYYDEEKYFEILKYIICHSNINKIEDRYFDKLKTSLFLFIYNYNIIRKELIDNNNNKKEFIDIIKGLKYYSLYFEENNNNDNLIKDICNNILNYSINIEELKITKINKNNSIYFVNVIKYMKKLKSLSISCMSDDELLFNNISDVIEENSLNKLEMNINTFKEGLNILKKNKDSLYELTIKINSKNEEDNILIVKTLSDIVNLKKLKVIADFQILDENTIKFLSLKKVKNLEIPLYIQKYLFDFSLFFEKIPKLKKLIFYGINFNDNEEIIKENINIMNKFQLQLNNKFPENLEKIKFLECKKHSSFFVYNFIKIISESCISKNIKVLKIQNCDFGQNININKLIELIHNFKRIINIKLNYISFEDEQKFNYKLFNTFTKLEKLYFNPIIHKQNYTIKYLPFITYISKTSKYLSEIGLSPPTFDINIFKLLNNFKLFQKINIFNDNIFSNDIDEINKKEDSFIFTTELYDYVGRYLINFRDVNMKGLINIPKFIINDYFHKNDGDVNENQIGKYFCYQKLFSKSLLNDYGNVAGYSHKEKAFIFKKKERM